MSRSASGPIDTGALVSAPPNAALICHGNSARMPDQEGNSALLDAAALVVARECGRLD
jgi:hypothetical protein